MNWLIIMVICIIAGLTIYSYHRGFVKSALSMTLFLITILLVNLVNPYVTEFIMEQTPLYENIKESCMELYTPKNQQEIQTTGSDEEIINSYPIANILKKKIIKDNNAAQYQLLNVSAIEEYIAAYIAKTIISSAAYIITFILVSILLRVFMVGLDILTHLPVLKEINKAVGAVLGFAEGLIIVWLVFVAADIFGTTEFGISVQQQISSNALLQFLSDNNVIWKLMM
ncbi:MAG: CvpA family protein [Lachnospiraceae bacterium]|nr:CvpA family protein [Lachnospiraceae bacterium]